MDAWFQASDRTGREGIGDQRAQAGMSWRIKTDHTRMKGIIGARHGWQHAISITGKDDVIGQNPLLLSPP